MSNHLTGTPKPKNVRRNFIVYLVAYSIVIICFLFLMYQATFHRREDNPILWYAAVAVALVGIWINRQGPRFWDMGLKSRGGQVIVSLIILIVWGIPKLSELEHEGSLLNFFETDLGKLIVLFLFFVALLILEQYPRPFLGIAVVFLLVVEGVLTDNSDPGIATLLLLLLLVTYNLELFLSRQTAHLRHLWSGPRLDQIRTQASPTLAPTNLLHRWWRQISLHSPFRSPTFYAFSLFLIGLIGVPALGILSRNEEKYILLSDVVLGLSSGILLMLFYLMFWLIVTRQKDIVFPFRPAVVEDQALANSVTDTFVEELQHIALLLKLRRAEVAAAAGTPGLAMFVTSGGDRELIAQLDTLADIHVAETVRIGFGRLYSVLLSILSHTKVYGYIQRQADGSVEIRVESTSRGGRSQVIGARTVSANASGQIEKQALQTALVELAIALAFRTGKAGHLCTSLSALTHFVKGLDAGFEGNWWHAIWHYRQAVQIEEAEHGSFGLGRYHLGAALIFQGELEEGLGQLHQAQSNGPPLAETHYMLGLSHLYEKASQLWEHGVFHEIRATCRTALRLRRTFPEAYHLLGNVYYLRGRLAEQQATMCVVSSNKPPGHRLFRLPISYMTGVWIRFREMFFPFDETKLSELWLDPARRTDLLIGARHHYRIAAKYLRKAHRQYAREISRVSRGPYPTHLIAEEKARLIREKMSVTHKLGDAVRGLGFYSEADSYYDDVVEAYPTNVRTLIDRVKVYCLAENWEIAYRYLENRVLKDPISAWHPVTNLLVGWTLAGGTNSKNASDDILAKAVSYLDYALWQKPDIALRWSQNNWLPYFARAAWYVAHPKQATDQNASSRLVEPGEKLLSTSKQSRGVFSGFWQSLYSMMSSGLRSISDAELLEPFLTPPQQELPANEHDGATTRGTDSSSRNPQPEQNTSGDDASKTSPRLLSSQLRWIAWRIDSYLGECEVSDQEEKADGSDEISNSKDPFVGHFGQKTDAPSDCATAHKFLKRKRCRVAKLLRMIDENGSHPNLELKTAFLAIGSEIIHSRIYKRLRVAITKTRKTYKTNSKNTAGIDHSEEDIFFNRWLLDLFLELSILAVRMFAEAGAFEYGDELAQNALDMTSSDDVWPWHDKLGGRVLEGQMASLLAWQAYCSLKQLDGNELAVHFRKSYRSSVANETTNNRVDDTSTPIADLDFQIRYSETLLIVEKVLKIDPTHPLALYLKGTIYYRRGAHQDAIRVLTTLLDVLSPFDPQVHIANWEARRSTEHMAALESRDRARPGNGFITLEALLSFMQRVSGTNQYELVVDRSKIHSLIAEILADQDEHDASIRHIEAALIWNPFKDREISLFMQLARAFNRQEKLAEALSAAREARKRVENPLGDGTVQNLDTSVFLTGSKYNEPFIFEAFLHSKLGQRTKTLEIMNDLKALPDLNSTLQKIVPRFEFKDEGFEQLFKGINRKYLSFKQRDLQNLRDNVLNQIDTLDLGDDIAKFKANHESHNKQLKPSTQYSLVDLTEIERWFALAMLINDKPKMGEILQDSEAGGSFEQKEKLACLVSSRILEVFVSEARELLIQTGKILNNIAYVYAEIGIELDLAIAIARAQQAVELQELLSPLKAHIKDYATSLGIKYDTLGWAQYRKGDIEDALTSLKTAISYVPTDADINYHYSEALKSQLEINSLRLETEPDLLREMLGIAQRAQSHLNTARQNDRMDRLFEELAELRHDIKIWSERISKQLDARLSPEEREKKRAS